MNPWKKETILAVFRDLMRFAVWFCIVLIGLMTAVFAVAFSYRFLTQLWSWCVRVMFSEPW